VEEKKVPKQDKKPEKKVEAPPQTKQDAKKKGKKGKKAKQEEDDDLDAILADLELKDKAAPVGKGKKKGGKKDEPEPSVVAEESKEATPASTGSAPAESTPAESTPGKLLSPYLSFQEDEC
ncbi:hypothetical protein OESDEN_18361, partial [Oesophagostomum dentatum]